MLSTAEMQIRNVNSLSLVHVDGNRYVQHQNMPPYVFGKFSNDPKSILCLRLTVLFHQLDVVSNSDNTM